MSCVRANWKKKQQQQQQTERVLDSLALAGNRTRASRVAGENSTTEPPVPFDGVPSVLTKKNCLISVQFQ